MEGSLQAALLNHLPECLQIEVPVLLPNRVRDGLIELVEPELEPDAIVAAERPCQEVNRTSELLAFVLEFDHLVVIMGRFRIDHGDGK